MKQAKGKTARTMMMAVIITLFFIAACFVLRTETSYAATATATWSTQTNSAGQVTSVKLDMSSITGYNKFLVNIYRDGTQISQETVTTSVYDVSSKVLAYEGGKFTADGMAYKTGGFTDFETADELAFYRITIDKQGHGNNVKITHIINGTNVKTALKNAYINTFNTGGDDSLMRYYENGDAFMGVALHPLSNYSNIEELKAEACYLLPGGASQNYTLGGYVTLYDIWFKVINNVELTVQAPVCGTSTSISKTSGDWNWDSQTNTPVVTIPSGKGYNYTSSAGAPGSWWIASVENDGEPYIGDFTGGTSYAFQSEIVSDFGYVFPTDKDNSIPLTVKVNGKAIPRADAYNGSMPYSFSVISGGTVPLTIDGNVKASHIVVDDPGYAATCADDGLTDGSHCSACGVVLQAQTVIPGGHVPVSNPNQPATLTEDGMTGSTYCDRCGAELVAPAVISHPASFSLSAKSYVYSGVAKKPTVTVKDAAGAVIASSNYKLTYANNTNAGDASVTVTFNGGKYTGSKKLGFKITKATNPLNVKGKTATVKLSKLRKADQKLLAKKYIKTVKAGQGTMKYTLSSAKKGSKSFKKKFKVDSKTGKLTVKKGLKKGKYKLKVKVKAAGNGNYSASAEKIVTVTINVK